MPLDSCERVPITAVVMSLGEAWSELAAHNSCETLGQSLNLSELQFLGANNFSQDYQKDGLSFPSATVTNYHYWDAVKQ